jgi:hypothetical protein
VSKTTQSGGHEFPSPGNSWIAQLYTPIADTRWKWLASAVVALSAVTSLILIRYQSLWGDEATQLSALHLTVKETWAWLAGADPYRFGVPSDRMPPLSYVIFHFWAMVFGDSETSIRLASLTGSVIGLWALAAAIRRLSPNLAGIMVLAIFALSLSYVHYSIETRTYPFVVMVTSITLYALGKYIDAAEKQGSRKWFVVIVLLNVISLYLHYTSLIFAIAVFGTIGIIDLLERRSLLPAVLGLLVMGAATVPLIPLVSAGLKVKTALLVTEAQDVPRFFARLFASRADAVYLPVLLLLVGAKLAAMATSAASAAARVSGLIARQPSPDRVALIWASYAIVGFAGLCGILISAFILPNSMLQPHYSIWLQPTLAVLIAYPYPMTSRLQPKIHGAASLLTLTCTVASLGLVLTNIQPFTHMPSKSIAKVLAQLPKDTVVVYDYQAGMWWNGYYPVRYKFGADRPQYLTEIKDDVRLFYNASDFLPSLEGVPMQNKRPDALLTAKSVLYLRVAGSEMPDLRAYLTSGKSNIDDSQVEERFAAEMGLKIVSKEFQPGISSALIVVMQR